jgi:toxin ParE1/3/4
VTSKPIIPRAAANQDVEEAVEYYRLEGGSRAAIGVVGALERAYANLRRHPAAGSPRYAHELRLPGLRSWPLSRYPFVVFYVDRRDHIDVWRVLHAQRDIPAWMRDAAEP